jgi:hypothetical protein
MGKEQTNATLRIFNALGQVVTVKEMDRLSRTSFETGQFDPGVYLLHIESDQFNRIVRFIKE